MLLVKPCHVHFSLKAVASAARPRGVALRGHFFGFAFFTADFLAPFFARLPRSRTLSEFPLPWRLLKYWSGSRVEADGRRARSERGASPQRAVTRERRRPLLGCLAPDGLRRFWRWPALLGGPRSLRISALRSRLDQRQNRQQRGPLQYFNSLLKRPRRPVIGHVLLRVRNWGQENIRDD